MPGQRVRLSLAPAIRTRPRVEERYGGAASGLASCCHAPGGVRRAGALLRSFPKFYVSPAGVIVHHGLSLYLCVAPYPRHLSLTRAARRIRQSSVKASSGVIGERSALWASLGA